MGCFGWSYLPSHDLVKAEGLATKISKTNQEILDKNTYSKLWKGSIVGLANAIGAGGAGDVISMTLTSGLSTYDYWNDKDKNYNDGNMQRQQAYAQEILKGNETTLTADGGLWSGSDTRDTSIGVGQTVTEATIPVIGSNREVLKGLAKWGGEEVVEGNFMSRAFWQYFAGKTAKDMSRSIGKNIFTLKNGAKFGLGIIASVIANGVDKASNENENELYRYMLDELMKTRNFMLNHIKVLANTQ